MALPDSDVLAGSQREYLLDKMEDVTNRYDFIPSDAVIGIMKETVKIVFEAQRLSQEFRRSKAE